MATIRTSETLFAVARCSASFVCRVNFIGYVTTTAGSPERHNDSRTKWSFLRLELLFLLFPRSRGFATDSRYGYDTILPSTPYLHRPRTISVSSYDYSAIIGRLLEEHEAATRSRIGFAWWTRDAWMSRVASCVSVRANRPGIRVYPRCWNDEFLCTYTR